MLTTILFIVLAIVSVIAGILILNQLSRIQSDISDIKRDNERRIEYNKQRNEKRKEFKTNRKDIDKSLEGGYNVSKVSKTDKRG
jgi:cell division protein ZapA (FtsZ GTPase activity inhibitor)